MSSYVTMPGTSGNYVSSDSQNLLDADTAHYYQSKGLKSIGTVVTDAGFWSGRAVQDTYGGAGTNYPTILRHPGVSAATEYTYSSRLDASNWANVTSVQIAIQWVNAADASILYSYGTLRTGPTSVVEDSITGTSPALTAKATLFWIVVVSGAVNIFTGDNCLKLGSDTSFIPSVRIVGDLDMRARFAATDATPASAETLIGQRSGNSGYAMTLGTGGELVVYHGTGSGTRVETSSGLTLVAATDTVVRSVIDISAGTWTHYKNGVQFDTSGSFATTAGSPYAGPLAVGADSAGTSGNWDGDIYYAEVRDGIDGPVVARFSGADVLEAVT